MEKIVRVLHRVEDVLLAAALGVMVLGAFLQIVLRNTLGSGLYWMDPLLRHLVLWIAMLGAMVATREDNHISMDAVSYFLPPRLKSGARVITDLFAAAVCFFLAWAAVRFVADEMEWGSRAIANLPAWTVELILPAGFGVMALRYLVLTVVHGRRAMQPD